MARSESVRLTEGKILKPLLLFALPIFAGQLLQTLYHSVDSIVIGNPAKILTNRPDATEGYINNVR